MTLAISCIIPAYNEAPRIGRVLAAVQGHPELVEVIVVDDGSSDGTADIARGFAGVTVLSMPRNGGKSAAVMAGIAAARGEMVMLIDADLEGLTPAHITRLAAPVRRHRAEVSISLRQNAPTFWHLIALDYISGERVFPRSVLEDLQMSGLPGFGLEVRMNRVWLERHYRIAVVRWRGVGSPTKGRKSSWHEGLKADWRMMRDIFNTEPPWGVVRQIWQMRRASRLRGRIEAPAAALSGHAVTHHPE